MEVAIQIMGNQRDLAAEVRPCPQSSCSKTLSCLAGETGDR